MTGSVGDFRLGAGAVKVDIGRGSLAAIAIGVPAFALLSAASVYAGLDGKDTATAVVGFAFAAFFAWPLLLILGSLKKLLRPRGLAFDTRGVHYWQADSWMVLGWEEIAGIGIGYEQPPDLPTLRLGKYLADKALDGLKIERRRRIAAEVFPKDPQLLGRQPLLLPYRREQEPPAAGLPSGRWRFPLPPAPGLAAAVERGVQAFQGERWLGWFAR